MVQEPRPDARDSFRLSARRKDRFTFPLTARRGTTQHRRYGSRIEVIAAHAQAQPGFVRMPAKPDRTFGTTWNDSWHWNLRMNSRRFVVPQLKRPRFAAPKVRPKVAQG